MDVIEKVSFIHELVDGVKMDILKEVKDMPEEWDGVELRWYIAEQYRDMILDPSFRHKPRTRYKRYRTTCFLKGF